MYFLINFIINTYINLFVEMQAICDKLYIYIDLLNIYAFTLFILLVIFNALFIITSAILLSRFFSILFFFRNMFSHLIRLCIFKLLRFIMPAIICESKIETECFDGFSLSGSKLFNESICHGSNPMGHSIH